MALETISIASGIKEFSIIGGAAVQNMSFLCRDPACNKRKKGTEMSESRLARNDSF
jgi:hypothetical protein